MSLSHMGSPVADLVESSVGYQCCSGMTAMLLGGSPGGMLGFPEGVIKPGKVVLAVLVVVVQAWGLAESHLLTSLKEQGIHSSYF